MFLSIIYFVYNLIDLYLLICSQTKTTYIVQKIHYIVQKIHYIHNITYISYKSYWIRSHTIRFHESFQLNSLYFSRKKVMNTLEEKKKQNLLSRIKEKSPLPIWVFIIIFGPILPVFILIVYCIDWYYQVFIDQC